MRCPVFFLFNPCVLFCASGYQLGFQTYCHRLNTQSNTPRLQYCNNAWISVFVKSNFLFAIKITLMKFEIKFLVFTVFSVFYFLFDLFCYRYIFYCDLLAFSSLSLVKCFFLNGISFLNAFFCWKLCWGVGSYLQIILTEMQHYI